MSRERLDQLDIADDLRGIGLHVDERSTERSPGTNLYLSVEGRDATTEAAVNVQVEGFLKRRGATDFHPSHTRGITEFDYNGAKMGFHVTGPESGRGYIFSITITDYEGLRPMAS